MSTSGLPLPLELPVVPDAGSVTRRDAGGKELPSWVRRVLGIPLAWKLAGANALIVIAALATAATLHRPEDGDRAILGILAGAVAVGFAVNLFLVVLALRPLRDLESIANRIRNGDLNARVPASPLSDRGIGRIGVALNDLLDALLSDRARARRLAAEVIRAGDTERARVARDLHDSTAQTLSAIIMQLAALRGEIADPALAARVESVRAATLDALEEVRTISHTVHPRVLDDLGLSAALRNLGAELGQQTGVPVEVTTPSVDVPLPMHLKSTLYRVAQEAVANALRHGRPSRVKVRLEVEGAGATLEVSDDGGGFDPTAPVTNGVGMGIFSMRERLSLVNGSFELSTERGAGTRVRATVLVEPTFSPGSSHDEQ